MQWLLLAVVLVSAVPALGASPENVDAFLHLAPGTTASLPEAAQSILNAATDDFEAVLAGRSPHHAIPDSSKALPADGGTSFWAGPGYRLTVVKTLSSVAGIAGYFYGPVLDLDDELSPATNAAISEIRFYSVAELNKLLAK